MTSGFGNKSVYGTPAFAAPGSEGFRPPRPNSGVGVAGNLTNGEIAKRWRLPGR